ncbi:MAG: hypothetical protein V7K47_04670 [Nostoc sp.]
MTSIMGDRSKNTNKVYTGKSNGINRSCAYNLVLVEWVSCLPGRVRTPIPQENHNATF